LEVLLDIGRVLLINTLLIDPDVRASPLTSELYSSVEDDLRTIHVPRSVQGW
jgi:hypothetical protein